MEYGARIKSDLPMFPFSPSPFGRTSSPGFGGGGLYSMTKAASFSRYVIRPGLRARAG